MLRTSLPVLFARKLKVFDGQHEAYISDAMLISPSLVVEYPLEARSGWIIGQQNMAVEYKPLVRREMTSSRDQHGDMHCSSEDERFYTSSIPARIRQLAESAMTFKRKAKFDGILSPFFVSASEDYAMNQFTVKFELITGTAGLLPDVEAFGQYCMQTNNSNLIRRAIQQYTSRVMRTQIKTGWHIPAAIFLEDQHIPCVIFLPIFMVSVWTLVLLAKRFIPSRF